MSKHTEGEWRIANKVYYSLLPDSYSVHVCSESLERIVSIVHGKTKQEAEANARLIVKSKVMFELFKKVDACLKKLYPTEAPISILTLESDINTIIQEIEGDGK